MVSLDYLLLICFKDFKYGKFMKNLIIQKLKFQSNTSLTHFIHCFLISLCNPVEFFWVIPLIAKHIEYLIREH